VEISSRIQGLEKLKDLGNANKQKFATIFQTFLSKVLKNLANYLPLNDEVIDLLDFVELADEHAIIESKMRRFNDKFKIIAENQKEGFEEEFVRLSNKSFAYYRKGKKNCLP